MKAKLIKIGKKEFEVKKGERKGQKFTKIEFECAVEQDNGNIRVLKGSYGMEFAKKYFSHAKTITGKNVAEYVGEDVSLITKKRIIGDETNKPSIYEYILFMNVMHEGKIITLAKETTDTGLNDLTE